MEQSRTKNDLIFEVWEKLDCENVGAKELIEIENAVRERFGRSAVDSPMILARLLADEGADLRHSEIMALYVERNRETEYDAIFRNLLKFDSLKNSLSTIRNLENIRKKFASENDKDGLRLLREAALSGKREKVAAVEKSALSGNVKQEAAEIAQWLTIWLQSPEIFENWVRLRMMSKEFATDFGTII